MGTKDKKEKKKRSAEEKEERRLKKAKKKAAQTSKSADENDVTKDADPSEVTKVIESSSSQDTTGVTLLLFYQYIEPVWSVARHKEALRHIQESGERHGLGGRMRCAREGLNCTITGPYHGVRAWCDDLRAFDSGFAQTEFKLTDNLPDGQHFPALKAFPVDELVNYGLAGERAPPISETATHLEPEDYHKKMQEKDTVIIDVRNYYESAIGHFKPPESGATLIDPKMRKSTEFPVWLDKPETKELIKGKQVLMYCTGGVRCERASALLRQKLQTVDKDLGVKGVYQLQGGIHKYIEQNPEGGFWHGKNYTFDKRFAHGAVKKEREGSVETIGKCEACAKPWDRYRGKRRCPTCGVPSLICKDCFDADANGERKLGKNVKCKLCVEEGIRHKAEVKEKDRKELEEYERKLRDSGDLEQGDRGAMGEAKGAKVDGQIDQRDLTLGLTPSKNASSVTRVWIGNLHKGKVSTEILQAALGGGIKYVQWINDRDGQWKGFGFAEMKSPEAAALAVAVGEAEKKLFGRPIKVNFNPPDGKSAWPPPKQTIEECE